MDLTTISLLIVSTLLALSACSEELTSQAQKDEKSEEADGKNSTEKVNEMFKNHSGTGFSMQPRHYF